LYCCNSDECQYNKTDPLYCKQCLLKGRHPHYPPVTIEDILKIAGQQWRALNDLIGSVAATALA
jgi:hypothetical protein